LVLVVVEEVVGRSRKETLDNHRTVKLLVAVVVGSEEVVLYMLAFEQPFLAILVQ
jgi:hypothetical protein